MHDTITTMLSSRHILSNCLALTLALTLVFFVGCRTKQSSTASAKQSRQVMGTLAEITIIAPNAATAGTAIEAAYTRLEDVNRLMSDYRDDSEIGRLNLLPPDTPFTVSAETFFVLDRAADIAEASSGALDITCRPLVKLWKQAGKEKRLPASATIEQTQQRVGWQKLKLDATTRTVTKIVADMQIDVGAIAKGYAMDLAAEAAKAAGATNGLIDVGGDIVAFGSQSGGTPWRVGVQHPFQAGIMYRLAITDRAVATSGNQQRFSIIDGKRYSHIVDPRTGRPAEQAPSVTVIAPDGITADAWATVFSVLTVDEGRAKAEALSGIEVLWIWGTPEKMLIAKTGGFDRYVIP